MAATRRGATRRAASGYDERCRLIFLYSTEDCTEGTISDILHPLAARTRVAQPPRRSRQPTNGRRVGAGRRFSAAARKREREKKATMFGRPPLPDMADARKVRACRRAARGRGEAFGCQGRSVCVRWWWWVVGGERQKKEGEASARDTSTLAVDMRHWP